MKDFISQNRIFLSLYLLFLIAGGILINIYEKGAETIYFSSLHTPFFDQIFLRTTQLAEFPVMILILLIAIFSSYGKGLLLWGNSLFVFAGVAFFKKIVFASEVRPSVFFEGKVPLNFVQDMEIARYHSFPSGHTATAFALFFMLSILSKDKRWSVLFFALALMVAVSRVYLLQHFFRDVYFGSLLAVTITGAFYLTFAQSEFYNRLKWKDKALLK